MSERPSNWGWLAVLLFCMGIPILLPVFGFSVWLAFSFGNDKMGFGGFFTVLAAISGTVLIVGSRYSWKASATLSGTPESQVSVAVGEPREPTLLP
jgi:hypothetical protein